MNIYVVTPYIDGPTVLALYNLPWGDNCWADLSLVYNWAIQFGIPLYQAYCQ